MEITTGPVKILKKPDVTDLDGEKVMIDFESGNYFLLKGAANDIWNLLEDGITADQIITRLMEAYTVDEAECRQSTMTFLNRLQEIGFISIG